MRPKAMMASTPLAIIAKMNAARFMIMAFRRIRWRSKSCNIDDEQIISANVADILSVGAEIFFLFLGRIIRQPLQKSFRDVPMPKVAFRVEQDRSLAVAPI